MTAFGERVFKELIKVIIGELPLKTTLRRHLIVRLTIIRVDDSVGEDVERREPRALWVKSLTVRPLSNVELPHNPHTARLGI